ncbi:MAG: urease accessory UreF family protein [Pseudomonadota bacterium]
MEREEAARALLLAWFSPACPIGAFSYSHGLETLFAAGGLGDRAAAQAAIGAAVAHGAGWSDTVMCAHAYARASAGDAAGLADLCAFGAALAPSAERAEEAHYQGAAFRDLVAAVWPVPLLPEGRAVPLPVVVGAAGAGHGVPREALLQGALSAFAANLVSAAVRLVPLGQTDGQRITRDLAPTVAQTVRAAKDALLSDVGGFAPGLDVATIAHEVQDVRLFRS